MIAKNFKFLFLLAGFLAYQTFGFAANGKKDALTDLNLASPHVTYHIESLREKGIIKGYSDGTFKPKQAISRAELVVMAMRAANIPMRGENCYSDVADQWFAPAICSAKTQGLVNGYSDGTFKPNKTVNFAEGSKIISAFLKFPTYTQTDENWFQPSVKALDHKQAIPGNILTFAQNLTREDVVFIIGQGLMDDSVDYSQNRYAKMKELSKFTNPPKMAGTFYYHSHYLVDDQVYVFVDETLYSVPGADGETYKPIGCQTTCAKDNQGNYYYFHQGQFQTFSGIDYDTFQEVDRFFRDKNSIYKPDSARGLTKLAYQRDTFRIITTDYPDIYGFGDSNQFHIHYHGFDIAIKSADHATLSILPLSQDLPLIFDNASIFALNAEGDQFEAVASLNDSTHLAFNIFVSPSAVSRYSFDDKKLETSPDINPQAFNRAGGKYFYKNNEAAYFLNPKTFILELIPNVDTFSIESYYDQFYAADQNNAWYYDAYSGQLRPIEGHNKENTLEEIQSHQSAHGLFYRPATTNLLNNYTAKINQHFDQEISQIQISLDGKKVLFTLEEELQIALNFIEQMPLSLHTYYPETDSFEETLPKLSPEALDYKNHTDTVFGISTYVAINSPIFNADGSKIYFFRGDLYEYSYDTKQTRKILPRGIGLCPIYKPRIISANGRYLSLQTGCYEGTDYKILDLQEMKFIDVSGLSPKLKGLQKIVGFLEEPNIVVLQNVDYYSPVAEAFYFYNLDANQVGPELYYSDFENNYAVIQPDYFLHITPKTETFYEVTENFSLKKVPHPGNN